MPGAARRSRQVAIRASEARSKTKEGWSLAAAGRKRASSVIVTLLFSGIAKVAGAASWNKSPRPVCLCRRVGQTRKRKSPHEEGDAAAGMVASEGHIALGKPPCPGEAGWRGRQARLGMCNHFNMDPAIQQAYRRMTTK